jgi:hypothetical protein
MTTRPGLPLLDVILASSLLPLPGHLSISGIPSLCIISVAWEPGRPQGWSSRANLRRAHTHSYSTGGHLPLCHGVLIFVFQALMQPIPTSLHAFYPITIWLSLSLFKFYPLSIHSAFTHWALAWAEWKAYVEALTTNSIWMRGLWEVIRFRWGQEGAASWWNEGPHKKGKRQKCLSMGTHWAKATWGRSKKGAICHPRSWPSSDAEFASTLMWDLPDSRTRNNKCVYVTQCRIFCYSHPANTSTHHTWS